MLTPTPGKGTMNTSHHWDAGSRNLVISIGEKSPHSLAAFLCPSFSAAVGRVIRNGGVIWAWFVHGRTNTRFSTPLHATAHDVEIIGGGYSSLVLEFPL